MAFSFIFLMGFLRFENSPYFHQKKTRLLQQIIIPVTGIPEVSWGRKSSNYFDIKPKPFTTLENGWLTFASKPTSSSEQTKQSQGSLTLKKVVEIGQGPGTWLIPKETWKFIMHRKDWQMPILAYKPSSQAHWQCILDSRIFIVELLASHEVDFIVPLLKRNGGVAL